MSPLHLAEAAAGAVILTAVCLLIFLWARRHVIAGGRPMLLCALRTPTTPQWRLGLLRFGADRLDWFSVIGPSLRPERTWERAGMVLGAPAPAREAIPGLTDPIAAPASFAGQSFDIAMAQSGLTAIRAWTESSPPGFNVNIPGQFT